MADRVIADYHGVDPEPPNSITGTSTSCASTAPAAGRSPDRDP
jgi:hypothetical protein